MLALALIIGAYSYSILFLGLFHFLNFPSVLFATIVFTLIACILFQKDILKTLVFLKREIKTFRKIEIFFILLLFLIAIINLIGALGPELSFDALWYHLTIPKLFIDAHSVYFIKGELLYYSLWPKLAEMLYLSGLILGNEIIAKLIHFTFGILTTIVVYKIARLHISRFYSLVASLIFYSNLVVAWLSITAFVDLTRSFYEGMAFLYFLKYIKDKKMRNFVLSAVLLSLAISSKLLSIGSILIFIMLIFFIQKISFKDKLKKSILYISCSLLVPLPYLIISFYYTGNPLYPLFTKLISPYFPLGLLYPLNFVKSFLSVFLFSPDPLNPIYLIVLPLVILSFKQNLLKARYVVFYAIVSLFVFYLAPQTGGGRFIVAYLPALSVLAAVSIASLNKSMQKILLTTIILIAFISISYRFIANLRFIPVVLGYQTKNDFLMQNLNFSFGDFYDDEGIIKKIVKNNRVMIVGIHNLYYVDFPFTIPEWGGVGNEKYTLLYNPSAEEIIKRGKILYKNPITHVTLYRSYVR